MSMAKRRAEVNLLFESSSKKRHRLLHVTDTMLGNVSAGGGVCLSPVSLPDRCCRKRPHHFTEPEQKHEAAVFHYDTNNRKNAAEVRTVENSGKYQNHTSRSSKSGVKKRPREEPEAYSKALIPDATDKVFNGDTSAEDSVYNSFQYWRTPLPELDPSLLEELSNQCHTEQRTKVKKSPSDAMET